jgi:hypothetical protein
MEPASRSFSAYRNEMASHFARLRLRDASGVSGILTGNRLDERFAQCVWFESFLVHEGLETDSGKSLKILEPGRWNRQEGPDFQDAKLEIGGRVLSGDVEVHLEASGWRAHRHFEDPRYDSVVLHVYLHRAGPNDSSCVNSRGETIEQFAMAPALYPDLESVRQMVRLEDIPCETPTAWGQCQPLMCSLDEAFVEGLLDAAGIERMGVKIARYADQARGESLDQVLYQAVMIAMGIRSSKTLFFLLSKRAPLGELFDYANDMPGVDMALFFEAILLHVARFAPDGPGDLEDTETLAYYDRIRAIWDRFEKYFSDRLFPVTKRWNTGVRPVNFAQRRLAGVAHLLARWANGTGGVVERFAETALGFDASAAERAKRRWIEENLVAPFVVEAPQDFWARRYTFAGNPAAQSMKLIGESRALSLALNALLPLLFHYAHETDDPDLEKRLWAIYFSVPPLESNALCRHMQSRLFGDDARGSTLLRSEVRQQGLFQIFADCCNMNEKGCEDCRYLTLAPEASA